MKRTLIITAVLFLAYLATGIYQVRPGELAVVRRFGRALDEPGLPGLNLGLPWGLDRVDRVAVDERRQFTIGFRDADESPRDAVPPGQLLTGDNHLVDVRATVYYRVERDGVVDFVLNQPRIESILTRSAEEALAATLAGTRVDAVLLGQARELEPRMQAHLSAALARYRLGVVIESVNVTHAQPPAPLADVFREVNAMRNERDRARTEAEKARETDVSTARTYARQTQTAAQAARRDRVTRAGADADAFRALARQVDSPNALLTIYLKEMQQVLQRMQVKTVSDTGVDQTIILPGPDR